jgi:glycine oxidase
MRNPTTEVAVVGGGLVGLACAWRLALAGHQVTLVDPEPGRGASWAAAGMLAPVTEVHYGEEPLLRLNLAGAAAYPEFVAALEADSDVDCGYRRCGTLVVARDVDDNAELAQLLDFQQRLGLDVERLRSRDCRRLEPGLAPSVRGGILVAGDHQVDNRALVAALREACRRRGVVHVPLRAAGLRHDGGRVRGLALADGTRLSAGTVVLAAGWEAADLAGLPEPLPLRPVKGQLLHLRGPADAPLATRTVRGLEVYVVPRADGRLVVGATVEERGADRAVTAGGVYELLRATYELLPGVTELELVEVTAGLRPGTPDNAPLIGRGGLEGLVVAAGHYRNGVLLAPVTADAVAELVTAGTVPELLAPFSPTRFAPSVPV